MSFGIIFAVILSIIIISLFIFFISTYRKEEDQPNDLDILNNEFMKQYTHGYSELLVVERITGTSGRIGLKLIPRDIDFLKYYKNNRYNVPEFKPFIFWVPINKYHPYPKGTISDGRTIIKIEPLSMEDIHEDVRVTPYGQMMMKIMSENNINKMEKDYLIIEADKIKELINNDRTGELSDSIMKRFDEIVDKKLETSEKFRDKPSSSFNFPSGSK